MGLLQQVAPWQRSGEVAAVVVAAATAAGFEAGGRANLINLANAVEAATEAVADEQDRAKLLGMRQTFGAVAAVVQTTAITGAQLQALVALKDNTLLLAKSLAPVLQDAWWAEQLTQVWQTAAAEGVAEPMMSSIVQVCRDPGATPAAVSQAWATAEAKLARWRREMREGSTKAVEDALEAWLRQRMTAAIAGRAAVSRPAAPVGEAADSRPSTPGSAADDWVAEAELLRSRATWFHATCRPEALSELLADLTAASALAGAARKLDAGLALVPSLLAEDTCEALVQSMLAAFRECQGLSPDPPAQRQMSQALDALAQSKAPMTLTRAELAASLLDLLGGKGAGESASRAGLADSQAEGESAAGVGLADRRADEMGWRKTLHGFRMIALSERSGDMKWQDPAARLEVKEALGAWDAYGSTSTMGHASHQDQHSKTPM